MKLTILTAVYNDWSALFSLLNEVDDVLKAADHLANVIVMNDGSDEPESLNPIVLQGFSKIERVTVIDLVSNLGNQRAIAVGLAYVSLNTEADAIVIMDADGEDRPADIERLLVALTSSRTDIVVAKREKRHDGRAFRLFYWAYKALYRMLTGRIVDFGNFSALTRHAVRRLSVMPDLWVHYPSAVLRSKLRVQSIPADRGQRYDGRSKMSFVSLAIHALGGVALFSETAIVRVLIALAFGIMMIILAILSVVVLRLFAEIAIPGWASTTVGWMFIILVQLILGALLLAFILVGMRTLPPFWPSVHYRIYVESIRELGRARS